MARSSLSEAPLAWVRGRGRAALLSVPLVLASVSATTPAASATPVEEARRKLATEHADRGGELFDQGKWDAALDKFRAAYGALPSPAIALYEARCLVKLGRMLEADEAYGRAETFVLPAESSFSSRQAIVTAREEAGALRPRIPRLVVVITEAGQGGTSPILVRIDGRPLPATAIGLERPIDPGVHRIEATQGEDVWMPEEITLREGERRVVTLRFAGRIAPEAAPPPPVPPPDAAPPLPPPATPPAPPPTRRTLAFVGLGIGTAGMVMGVAAGAVMVSQKSDLSAACQHNVCPPSAHDDLDVYRRTRTLSNVGYGVGLVGLAAGGVLLLVDSRRSSGTVAVRPFVSPSWAGLSGAF